MVNLWDEDKAVKTTADAFDVWDMKVKTESQTRMFYIPWVFIIQSL